MSSPIHIQEVTPSTPHLLGLPRELRDEIYGYLVHECSMQWMFDGRLSLLLIRINAAPYPSLLRTHTKLYDEYKELRRFARLSITITDDASWANQHCEQYLKSHSAHALVLSRAHHITAVVKPKSHDGNAQEESLSHFFEILVANTANLITLRVMRIERQLWVTELSLQHHMNTLAGLPAFYTVPARAVLNLPLVQLEQGYHVDCAGEDVPKFGGVGLGSFNVLAHRINGLRIYLYTNENDENYRCKREIVIKGCAPREYDQDILNQVSPERAEKLTRTPHDLIHWKEF